MYEEEKSLFKKESGLPNMNIEWFDGRIAGWPDGCSDSDYNPAPVQPSWGFAVAELGNLYFSTISHQIFSY